MAAANAYQRQAGPRAAHSSANPTRAARCSPPHASTAMIRMAGHDRARPWDAIMGRAPMAASASRAATTVARKAAVLRAKGGSQRMDGLVRTGHDTLSLDASVVKV